MCSSTSRADHFVITATEDSKEVAQKKAPEKGGWVLDTNLYAALTPNKYSVVRGPFANPGDAQLLGELHVTLTEERGGVTLASPRSRT